MRFRIYPEGCDPERDRDAAIFRSKTDVFKLVSSRQARWVDAKSLKRGAIMLISGPIPRKPFIRISSNQKHAYRELAIETHPQVVLGGLTRTETKPDKFSRFKAARVGCAEV